MESVQSSTISAVGYSEADNVMTVAFKNGSTYTYQGVPQKTYQAFLDSESKGKYFNRNIRGQFDYLKR